MSELNNRYDFVYLFDVRTEIPMAIRMPGIFRGLMLKPEWDWSPMSA